MLDPYPFLAVLGLERSTMIEPQGFWAALFPLSHSAQNDTPNCFHFDCQPKVLTAMYSKFHAAILGSMATADRVAPQKVCRRIES